MGSHLWVPRYGFNLLKRPHPPTQHHQCQPPETGEGSLFFSHGDSADHYYYHYADATGVCAKWGGVVVVRPYCIGARPASYTTRVVLAAGFLT
jgi:hypothetical protein